MTSRAGFEAEFSKARQLQAAGRLAEAEQAYKQLTVSGKRRALVLSALAELYMQAGRPQQAVEMLGILTAEEPGSLAHRARLAALLQRVGDSEAAIDQYRIFLKRQPQRADAYFNLALLYKSELRYGEALDAYESSLRLGIDNVQEVYSNMGVLYSEMRRAAQAREMYERALEVDSAYVPALFNLAGLCEETGDRQQAADLYGRILAADPGHWESLARLAHATRRTDADDELVNRLQAAIAQTTDDPSARETLQFALGKALDDVGRYQQAYAAYAAANDLGGRRNVPYDRRTTERAFEDLIATSSADWLESHATASAASPIFICGMFRSGSTLIEQMLGAHPAVTAAGELDFLPWVIARKVSPYPQRINSLAIGELEQLGEEYLLRLQELFPGAENITDKRPDNFLHLGLVKAMFPAARIVYTRRSRLDNCLSIYFQQLGGQLSYACDVHDAAHYYAQHERLMGHWLACLGDNIYTVDYDELVRSPEPVLRGLLEFLGLAWDERCLEFERANTAVKSASIWQVREGITTTSSGRWRNYHDFIPGVEQLLDPDDAQPE